MLLPSIRVAHLDSIQTPDYDVIGFANSGKYKIGDLLKTGTPVGYREGEEYKVDGVDYQLYIVYYFEENGYLVEVIYLREIETDNYYLASNANIFKHIGDVKAENQISIILPSLDPADYNSPLPGYELLISGAEETAKAINAKITVYRYNHTDGETTADEEAGAFEKAINMESDAIIFVPFGPFAGKSFYNTIIEPCLQMADDAGIPVILVDYLPASGTYPIVATDHYESGVLAGEIAASMGKPGEKAAVISGPEAILPLTLHIKGFMDGLSDFAPGMELIDPIFIDFVAETGDLAEVATNELIETYPDLSVIFATNCNLGGPAQNVIDYTGHSDEVSLIVFNATNYSIDELETGGVDCIIQPDYFNPRL